MRGLKGDCIYQVANIYPLYIKSPNQHFLVSMGGSVVSLIMSLQNNLIKAQVCTLVRAACVHSHGTKCPLLTALFLFLSSFRRLTFLPEGVIIGFQNCAWGLKSHKNYWGTKKIGGPPMPPLGGRFVRFFPLLNKCRTSLPPLTPDPSFFTLNHTPSILHSASFKFQPYSRGWSLTSKKPFLLYSHSFSN
jgi:hypothetical protein